MRTRTFKKTFSVIVSMVFLSMGQLPGLAQTLSTKSLPNSGVLVSGPRVSVGVSQTFASHTHSSTDPPSRINRESSLVDIQAMGAASVHSQEGKTGMAREQSFGQGVILDASGIIATNTHVIENAEHIYVYLAGGRKFEAHLIHTTNIDLSFIKIEAPYPLKTMSLASNSPVKAGQEIIAFTNAGLNAQRQQSGEIIDVLNVPLPEMQLLEIKISLNPGDSGGAVVDAQGCLVGLIMANSKSDHSKSFAIALSSIQQEYLKSKGSVIN